MNAHHTIGIVSTIAKMPAGAPATRLASKIAGKKAAKYKGVPNITSISWTLAANARIAVAAMNAGGDHGLSRRMYSVPTRMKRPLRIHAGNKLPEYSWKRKHHRNFGKAANGQNGTIVNGGT